MSSKQQIEKLMAVMYKEFDIFKNICLTQEFEELEFNKSFIPSDPYSQLYIDNRIRFLKRMQYNIIKFIFIHLNRGHSLEMILDMIQHTRLRRCSRYYEQLIAFLSAPVRTFWKQSSKKFNYRERRVIDWNILVNEEGFDFVPTAADLDPMLSAEEIYAIEKRKAYVEKRRLHHNYIQTVKHVFYPDFSHLTPPVIKRRNITLLTRLRKIILELQISRSTYTMSERLRYKIYRLESLKIGTNSDNMEYAHTQMDTAQGNGILDQKQAGNVVLTEAVTNETGNTGDDHRAAEWVSKVSSDVVNDYSTMTDRWLRVKDFTWSTGNKTNTELLRLELPRDVIINEQWTSCEIPNTLPFRVHRYWRGDMEIKIQINSNKFQIGQLQCSWLYEPYLDPLIKNRENIYTLSQTEHVLISAGASNEATLYIPYKNHLPMIHTKKRKDVLRSLHVGVMYIFVINPLSVSTTGPTTASGTIFVRFINSAFTGQIHGSLNNETYEEARTQMDTAVKMAMGALSTLQAPNMDNPPGNRAPNYFVPTGSHSWSIGNNIVEPLQQLRLQNGGQTAHPDNNIDEMSVKYVAEKYGLVCIMNWKDSHKAGTQLESFNASPIVELKHYMYYKKGDDNDANKTHMKSYVIPPVGVLASLYNFWRGSLRFRFDVIASQFHTGRLLVGYVPGATSDDKDISIRTILAGPHMIFNLQESQSFTYEIPYIASTPYWHREFQGNYTLDAVVAPSRLYIYVLNPLVPMQSVYSEVYVNVYMAAGKDFELAVPVQPASGLSFNTTVLYKSSELMFALSGQFPYYAGTFYAFLNSQYLCMRVGATSGNVAYFDGHWEEAKIPYKNCVYYTILHEEDAPIIVKADGSKQFAKFGILVRYGDHFLLVPVKTEDGALELAKAYANDGDPNKWSDALRLHLFSDTSTGNNTYSNGNPGWKITKVPVQNKTETVYTQGENIEDYNVITTGSTLCSLDGGRYLYGENFMHLKDLARRYQLYGSYLTTLDNTNVGQCSFSMHIFPQGLALDVGTISNIIELANRARDGHIPIILSGYRYYRGGVRLRLLAPTNTDTMLWVQHRPDRKCHHDSIIPCTTVTTAEALFNHGYASYIQDTGVNAIMEIEVPFYQNGAYGLLQRPRFTETSESFYYGNGELMVGFNASKKNKNALGNYVMSIFYALADDFVASTFQGFPPIVILDNIENVESAHTQMGLVDKFKKYVRNEIQTTVREEVTPSVESIAADIHTKIEEVKEDLQPGVTQVIEKPMFRSIISQIAHVTVNCNWKAIGVAIVTCLIEVGIFGFELMTKALEVVQKCLKYFSDKISITDTTGTQVNQPVVPESANTQSDNGESDTIGGYLSLLWTSICSVFAIREFKHNESKTWSSFLTKDLTNVMRSSNFFVVFIRNTLNIIYNMYDKAFGKINPTIPHIDILSESYPEYQAWIDEVERLTDPAFSAKHKYSVSYQTAVDIAYAQAIMYHSKLAITEDPRITSCIRTAYRLIKKCKDDIVCTGSDNMVRKEPFVIWQYGDAGIGKSFVSNNIIMNLLKAVDIQLNGPPIYVHNASNKFWDGCTGNPAMQIDDMFNIQHGDNFDTQLATLFQVVSPVVLIPPKARLDEKGIAYNPELIFINSNYDFINVDRMCLDAIHRRRNILIKTVLSKNITKKPKCQHCELGLSVQESDPKDLADFHHLQFYYTFDVTTNPPTYQGPFTYDELITILVRTFKKNRIKANSVYKSHLQEIQRLLVDDICVSKIAERIEHYRRVQHQWLIRQKKSLFIEAETLLGDSVNYVKRFLDRYLQFEQPAATQAPVAVTKCGYNYILEKTYIQQVIAHAAFVDHEVRSWNSARIQYFSDQLIKDGFANHILRAHDTSTASDYVDEIDDIYEEAALKEKYGECQHIIDGTKNLVVMKNATGQFSLFSDSGKDLLVKCEAETCITELDFFKSAVCHIIELDVDYDLNKHLKDCIHPYMKTISLERVSESIWKEVLQKTKEKLCNAVLFGKKILQFLWDHKKAILGSLALLVSVFGIVVLGSHQLEHPEYTPFGTVQRITKGWGVPRLVNKHATCESGNYDGTVQSRILTPSQPIAHAQSNTQQYSVVIDRLRNNMFSIIAHFNGKSLTCTGLIIRERQCLMLRHYIEELQMLPPETTYQGTFPLRTNSNIKLPINFRELNVVYYEMDAPDETYNSNYCLLELPLSFPESKKITQFIANAKDHRLINGAGSIYQTTGVLHDNVVYVNESKPMIIKGVKGVVPIKLCSMYTYKMNGRGMCGNILLANNLERPIIGMHVAGVEFGNVRGIAEPLHYEMFETLPKTRTTFEDIVIPELTDAEFSALDLDANIFKLGCTDSQYTNFQSSVTQIVPSLIQGCFEVKTEPNPLRKNDPRLPDGTSPLIEGCRHFGKPPLDFPRITMDNAYDNLRSVILMNVKPIRLPVRVLSLQEAIVGNAQLDGIEPLEWSTSPGFPLKFEKDSVSQSGKKWLFDLEESAEGYILKGIHPKLKQKLQFDDSLRKRNLRPFTVFIDCLKDTCLPKEKCRVPGKTRIFSISPIQYTIRFRQYLGEYMAAYRKARLSAEHAIGIDSDSYEWTQLALHLNEKGNKIIAGDYKNFGPSLMFECVYRSIQIILDWYEHKGSNAEDQKIRKMLLMELITPYHLVQNLIYQTPAGIPSGSPITDILNSMVNSLYVRCIWQLITKKPMCELLEHANIVTYGDDICINISDTYADVYNTATMANEFSKYNIVFTDADKSNNIVLYRDLTTVSFLKRKFLLHPTRTAIYLAALDPVSIEGCANWILKRNDARIATQQNAEQCLLLAYGQGPEYYHKIKKVLEKHLLEISLPFKFMTWEELDVKQQE